MRYVLSAVDGRRQTAASALSIVALSTGWMCLPEVQGTPDPRGEPASIAENVYLSR